MYQSLRKFRKQNKVSLSELSLKTGLSLRYLVQVEDGNVQSPKEHQELIRHAIGMSWTAHDVGDLLDRKLSL